MSKKKRFPLKRSPSFLVDSLSSKEKAQVLEIFSKTGSVAKCAHELKLDPDEVRALIMHPEFAQEALTSRKAILSLQFIEEVIPNLLAKASGADKGAVGAARLVAEILGYKSSQKGGDRNRAKERQVNPPSHEELVRASLVPLNDAENK